MCHFTFFLLLLIAYQSPKNASQIDKLNKDLQSHNASKESLETLKELCGYAGKIQKNSFDDQSCKNLLDNLCTGLEKFLGYQDGNYTGEGIVYSDLDRLCDGVMAFLYGVLEAVKADDAVKTYDNDLSGSKLNDVLKELESSIGTGSVKFGPQVTAVSAWLGRYERSVEGKIKVLKNPIKNLIKDISEVKDEIAKQKYFEISEQIALWKERAGQYVAKVGRSESALNDVDKNLKMILSPKIDLLKQATERFEMNARNDDLNIMLTFASDMMYVVTQFVNTRTKKHSADLQMYLTDQIGKLHTKIGMFKSVQFSQLIKSVNGLHEALYIVKAGIASLETKYGKEILGGVQEIKTKVSDLKDLVNREKATLQQQVSDLGFQMDKLKELNTGVIENMPEELDGFTKDEWSVNDQIAPLYSEITSNVQGYVGELADGLKAAVTAAVVSIGQTPGLIVLKSTPLGEIQQVGAWIGQAVGPEADPILGADLERFLSNLKDAESNWKTLSPSSTKIYGIMREAIKKAISDKATDGQFKTKLFNLVTAAVVKGIAELQEAVTQVVTENLNKIKEDLEALKNKDDQGKSPLKADAAALLSRIEQFLNENVGENGDKAGTFHKDLKHFKQEIDKLERKVGDVVSNVDAVGTELQGCISQAEKLLHDSPTKAKTIIHQLLEEVNSKITKGYEALQNKTKDLYTKRKITEFEALQSIVQEQFTQIERIIDIDKKNGVKGFLSKLNSKFTANVKRIESIIAASASKQSSRYGNAWLSQVAEILQHCFREFLEILKMQDEIFYFDYDISDIWDPLDGLFKQLKESQHFNHRSNSRLTHFEIALSNLPAERFPDPPKAVLSPLKSGMANFTKELSQAYVNAYSGKHFEGSLLKDKDPEPQLVTAGNPVTPKPSTPHTDKVLTTEGLNCAKVCLTIMEGLRKDVFDLRRECEKNWKEKQICMTELDSKKNEVGNSLGQWLTNRGYKVATDKDKQDGELRRSDKMKGTNIYDELLNKDYVNVSQIPILKEWKETNRTDKKDDNINLFDITDFLREFFRKYYQVCQHKHILSPKAPSNIYQMLCWLSGLRWNPMYDKLGEYFKELYYKPKGQEAKPYKDFKDTDLSIPATSPLNALETETLTPKILKDGLEQVCLLSQLVAIAFLGNGHAGGRYACDFRTNPDELLYPSNSSSCFDILVDILKRVFYQLRFLCSQCSNSRSRGGWAECHYGRYIGGSSWDCNEKQCANQECPHTANLTATQNKNQTCDQHPQCGVKSPLQSFLEDGLPGFLPHSFKTPGCKLTCTIPNHFGKPCLTPMGFTDICVAASHTKTGAHLRAEVSHLCGDAGKPLTKLCSYLNCLLRVAPQTLGDMLAFYYQLLKQWTKSQHKKTAFDKAVRDANFGQESTKLDPTAIQLSSAHSDKHSRGDLFSLTECNHKTNPGLPCGKYLHPLTLNSRSVLSEKRAGNYLSWVVYSTETFLGQAPDAVIRAVMGNVL
ncbi:hypothetical protein, conserved [Babesia ovata]|uniref:C3H1-type domain-containing protein n=1 Tax=Babesia ovata TaxID=189622 RepID=A0A2H6KK37_9APIC|nr:uncharacterized protein BOVATA_048580 [Babesia ovata]GBE63365.1 hypothetical protein, conserved [Babesia ovata]